MISLSFLYLLLGLLLLWIALLSLCDRTLPNRFAAGAFWGCYALVFLVGDFLPHMLVGIIVVILALLAGSGALKASAQKALAPELLTQSMQRLGRWIFLPPLLIPLLTVFGVLVLSEIKGADWALLDAKNLTLVSLGLACVLSLPVVCGLTREKPVQAGLEAKRLMEAMGWAVLLPQLLATLGLLFNEAGVGTAVAALSETYLAVDERMVAVCAYSIGMALFTIIMGNAFAAFPVITAGIGIPLLVMQHGANPAVMAAIGMFSGYCGTLMTPMAANFNIVPAALLELKDPHLVIKAQFPTALLLLVANIVLLYFLAF
ncbi:DUF979 domain-containing protein [Rheinheimera sp.]|uniref:DUF979 domain-containing protein n=1 Tax=Rheinheimera sp. TaxID=1869214 RepID=UPI0027BAD571|nr:DUF979 domain-containing protein [Rheinheimera sp.]